ncbi:complement factor H-like isoform X2 [Cyprinodon tularosa]|uniref:complement factor H-like isoform X2 n=1 Tax=Cyprinodon tularosa TaxID=77115 RepID=UPI0018E1F94D|nr:complement factor H-like isoform X2 [Cyprinodon tularosa]
MHMMAKSCVLLLWLHLLTSVESKDCTIEKFLKSSDYDSNFDTSGLESSYAGGRQVRIPCNVGYSGFFKIICTEGNWEPRGTKCKPKPCGHPGDAQFADFRLNEGTDFVFGSEVVYECNRGYHMVSRTNRRRCTADGWDGNIPVCEATKCPVFHVDNNVQVFGDVEEATSGSVVRFSCMSRDEILYGQQEIFCQEDGEWSGPIPNCKEIRCSVPHIDHGSVPSSPREYKEHETLNFRCDAKFIPADERPPRCTKFAGKPMWSPTPACKPIQCSLTLPPLTGTTYDPPYTNVFIPGDTLRVTCGEKYWIVDTGTTVADLSCKEDGKWDAHPVCQEVTCPRWIEGQHLKKPVDAWRGHKLGDSQRYDCAPGSQPASRDKKAICTRDGWAPKPLCRGPCEKPQIRNGFAVGPLEGTLYFACNENYKLPTKSWWGQAKCKDGDWEKLLPCIEKDMCGEAPEISNGRLNVVLSPAVVQCNEGYTPEVTEITCLNGEWNFYNFTPKTICRATSKHCGPPPKVENAIVTVAYKKKYSANSSVTYRCREKYQIEKEDTVTCRSGEWEVKNITCTPYCEKLTSSRLVVEEAMEKQRYLEGEVIEYVCTSPHVKAGGNATCRNGEWIKTEECPGIPCRVPQLGPGLGISGFPPENNLVKSGKKLRFYCREEYDIEGSAEIKCLETGDWDAPLPTCSEKCRIPNHSETVRIASSVPGNALEKGFQLSFSCEQNVHIMKGSKTITCLGNGKWSDSPPECERALGCSAPPSLPNGETRSTRSYFDHGEQVEYFCRDNYNLDGGSYKTCENGEWKGDMQCIRSSGCSHPPQVDNGDTVLFTKPDYQEGERVEYSCFSRYTMEGGPFKTCRNGKWEGEMRCLDPCTVDEQLMEQNNLRFAYSEKNKLYIVHKDYISFSCKRGRRVGRVPLRVQCIDGVMELPTCQ